MFNFGFETERLYIRNTVLDDVDLLLKMDKQEKTQIYLGGIKHKSREERIIFLENKINKYKDGYLGYLTVCLKDKTPIGFIGLSVDSNKRSAKLSYIFDYDYCSNGYCTEACFKLLEYGFDKIKLDSIYADTVIDNISSKRVLEKLGFKNINSHFENEVEFLDYVFYKNEGSL